MRTASVSLVQFLTVWILSIMIGAVAVLVVGLPGLVVLFGLMIGGHMYLNRRITPSSGGAGPELPPGTDPD